MIQMILSPDAPHQKKVADALLDGFRLCGKHVELADQVLHYNNRAHIFICWGWRNAEKLKRVMPDSSILVVERGYVGDRMGTWYSLGWDGLNGRARFPLIDDGGARWRQYFPNALQSTQADGDYVLLLGQVRGDASLAGAGDNHAQWYQMTAQFLAARSELPVLFRPHPQEVERYGSQRASLGLDTITGALDSVLADAACAWAYNSNSLVDAALAGVPVHAIDEGAMVWPIVDHDAWPPAACDQIPAPDTALRERWAHRLAWCQWTLDEMRSGAAWEAVQSAMDVAPWCAAWEEELHHDAA